MYLLIDTSTEVCRLQLVDNDSVNSYDWQAGRDMARGLLQFITTTVESHTITLKEIEGIGVFRGPGSFTGLRIGVATVNTLAAFAHIPVVGAAGDDWANVALRSLKEGRNDKIIVPEYGRPARITQPKK